MALKYAWAYRGTTTRGAQVAGLVVAPSGEAAHLQLYRQDIKPTDLSIAPLDTVKTWLGREADDREVSMVYRSIAKRIDSNSPLAAGLEAMADFAVDSQIRGMCTTMRIAIDEGRPLAEAMESAGLPERDVLVVRASSEAAKESEALVRLADDIVRKRALRAAIRKTFSTPLLALILGWIATFVVLWKVAPNFEKFAREANSRSSGYQDSLFAISGWLNDNLVFGSAIFLVIPLIIFMLARNKRIARIVDAFRLIREMRFRSDLSSLWGTLGVLVKANIPPAVAIALTSRSAALPRNTDAFVMMQRAIESGESFRDAAVKANMPTYVVAALNMYEEQGDTAEGMLMLSRSLEEDVQRLTDRLEGWMTLLSVAIMILVVLGVFMVTYYPVIEMSANIA